jgi:hypothetical protein
MRGKPDNTRLIREDVEPAAAIRKLAGERDWLFLDTAPAMMDQVELAVQAADFVLIPVLASAFDLVAARAVVALCTDHCKSFAFVLNRKNLRRELLHSSAATHLHKLGPMLPEQVRDRAAYVSALNKGLTGPEHPDARQAREDRGIVGSRQEGCGEGEGKVMTCDCDDIDAALAEAFATPEAVNLAEPKKRRARERRMRLSPDDGRRQAVTNKETDV